MVPCLIGFILPPITYVTLKAGLVPDPSEVFSICIAPIGISSWLVTKTLACHPYIGKPFSYPGIWYPFFKVLKLVK
jgi:PTS system cellobiose-specific IIC component